MRSIPDYSPEELRAQSLESKLAERLRTAGPVALACLRMMLVGTFTTEEVRTAMRQGAALLREIDELTAECSAAQKACHRRTKRGRKP